MYVQPLSEQLNGRLGAVDLHRRHVEVVHKHHTSVRRGGRGGEGEEGGEGREGGREGEEREGKGREGKERGGKERGGKRGLEGRRRGDGIKHTCHQFAIHQVVHVRML